MEINSEEISNLSLSDLKAIKDEASGKVEFYRRNAILQILAEPESELLARQLEYWTGVLGKMESEFTRRMQNIFIT